MATVKTVLVKGRSNRSGKFPLVVQALELILSQNLIKPQTTDNQVQITT